MPIEVSDDRLIIKFDLDEPLILEEVSEGFAALSRQYEKTLQERGISKKDVQAKLMVTRLESGSLETELALWAFMGGLAIQAMDAALIITDFSERIKRFVSWYSRTGAKPESVTKEDAHDFEQFIKPLAGRKGAKLNVRRARFHSKDERREILAEYEFDERALTDAFTSITSEVEAEDIQPAAKHKIHKNVLFYWHQTNRDEGKSTGRTGDRGIIKAIHEDPLPVYFPKGSESAKNSMIRGQENPFRKGYMIDVDVQVAEGKPAVYTVLQLHQEVPLPEPDNDQGRLV